MFDESHFGLFAIKAHGVSYENIYILLVTCNRKPYIRNYLTHEMLISDGVLEFQMGQNQI